MTLVFTGLILKIDVAWLFLFFGWNIGFELVLLVIFFEFWFGLDCLLLLFSWNIGFGVLVFCFGGISVVCWFCLLLFGGVEYPSYQVTNSVG